MTTTKTCRRCHDDQPADTDHYYRDTDSPDGLTTICKTCKRSRERERQHSRSLRRAEQPVCHACPSDRCDETFVCGNCGRELNVCATLVGGFGAADRGELECVYCFERRVLGPVWVSAWGGKFHNVADDDKIEAVVRAAVRYQRRDGVA